VAAKQGGDSEAAKRLLDESNRKMAQSDALGGDPEAAQRVITTALNARLAEIAKGASGSDAEVASRQKELFQLMADMASLAVKAKDEAGTGILHGQGVKGKRTPDLALPDLSKFATKVIGGFSADQLRSQSNLIGLVDPLKDIADNTAALVKQGEDAGNDDTYE
jgi:hypothetical protein